MKIKIFLLYFVQLAFLSGSHFSGYAQKASYTLKSDTFNNNQVIFLDTIWDFYPQTYIDANEIENTPLLAKKLTVPGYWDTQLDSANLWGYGTYHIQLINPSADKDLIIYVGQVLDAYKLWVNGSLVASSGKIATDKLHFKGGFKPQIAHIKLRNGNNHLVLHVANFENHHSGIYNSIEMGTPWAVFYELFKRIAFDLILFGSLLFMSIYHFALFGLRREDKSSLIFAIFSAFMAVRTIFTGSEAISFIYPDISFQLSYKLEYLSYYLGVPVFGYFLYSLFKENVKIKIVHIVSIITLIFSVGVIFGNIDFFTFYVVHYQIITLIALIYFIYVIVQSILKRAEAAWILGIGIVVFFIGIFNDMLFINGFIKSTELAPFSFFIFMFSQAYLLSHRFSKAFIHNKLLSAELDHKNRNLEEIVLNRTAEIQHQKEEITAQAELLHQTNRELEKLSIVASETDNAVIIFDKNLNIEWVNKAFEQIYGYNLQEFVAERGANILANTNDLNLPEKIETLISTGQSFSYENAVTDRNGQNKWMQTTLTPVFDDNGNLSKLVAIDSDITKMKLAEHEILRRNIEIQAQKEHLEQQNAKIEFQNHHINSSISYAKDIQQAILPINHQLNRYCETFVIYEPKDVVSGDLYWVSCTENYQFFAVIDCTGHGVPGAFMSMIAERLISSIINEKHITDPATILSELETGVVTALKQQQTENKDGMDVCLVRVETKCDDNQVHAVFGGAKRPLFIYRHKAKELEQVKGDHLSIGGIVNRNKNLHFSSQPILLEKGDTLYLSSDGYIDQNDKGRKRFGTDRFLILLKEIAELEMDMQKNILLNVLKQFQNDEPQRDDITIMGIRI